MGIKAATNLLIFTVVPFWGLGCFGQITMSVNINPLMNHVYLPLLFDVLMKKAR
jgi:hypothetical protein